MKKLNYLLGVLFIALFLSSCSEDSNEQVNISVPVADSGQITGNFGGNIWSESASIQLIEEEANLSFILEAGDVRLSIAELNSSILGTYKHSSNSVVSTNLPVSLTFSSNNNIYSNNAEGGEVEIQITSLDTVSKVMSGIFLGTIYLEDGTKMDVKEGSFTKVSYTLSSNNSGDKSNSLSANIDVTPFSPNSMNILNQFGIIQINALGTENSLQLIFPETITVGTYPLEHLTNPTLTYSFNGNSYLSYGGTLEIMKHDTNNKELVGTFSSDVYAIDPVTGEIGTIPEYSIASGAFEIYY